MNVNFELFGVMFSTLMFHYRQPIYGSNIFVHSQFFEEKVRGNEIFNILLCASCAFQKFFIDFMTALFDSDDLSQNH